MKIIEEHIIQNSSFDSDGCVLNTCSDDCNNCWEYCNTNDGDCFPDCNNCKDYT